MDDGRKTQVTFQYIVNSTKWDVEKPYRIHDLGHDCIGDVAASNLAFESRPSMVNDIRGKDENLRLEDCGFKYSKFSPSAVPGSSDSATLTYCNEVVALLHRHVSAERIICYDLRVRLELHLIHRSLTSRSIEEMTKVEKIWEDSPITKTQIDLLRLCTLVSIQSFFPIGFNDGSRSYTRSRMVEGRPPPYLCRAKGLSQRRLAHQNIQVGYTTAFNGYSSV